MCLIVLLPCEIIGRRKANSMLEESVRQSYLKAMGVTQWQLRTKQDDVPDVPDVSDVSDKPTLIKGLKWLNKTSKNGLLVVLSEQRKELTPESRQLMSKMLKGIHFLPSETGFAISGETASSDEDFSLNSVKAILVLGNEAGRQLVKFSGAKIVPGTEYFSLASRTIVITVHPDDLLSNSDLKQQTWNDLKRLVQLFNNN